MRYTADLHIHSHFSRATSPELNFPNLHRAALRKGIEVVGTGDFTHPGWLEEMEEFLEPAPEMGLYRLKPEFAAAVEKETPASCLRPVRFVLSGEISCIYKKGGKTRKVHDVVFAPDIATARAIGERLGRIGNLKADGRPILGLDSKHLLEILAEASERAYLIPAHIWTPWFSVLGANSGFDDIEECFEDWTDRIFALETGLSSDPAMNWLCSRLDRFSLVSNSDAHSPSKLGREANLFDAELSYDGLFDALKGRGTGEFLGTVEFYPEEGKYHYDGHRNCKVRWSPEETVRHDCLCSVCGKPVTVGVMHRVAQLADRKTAIRPQKGRPFESLIGLETVVAETLGCTAASRKVAKTCADLAARFGSELEILRHPPIEQLEAQGMPVLAEALQRMREGRLEIEAGYDGEYGRIRIFGEGEREACARQDTFFADWGETPGTREKRPDEIELPELPELSEILRNRYSRDAKTQNSESFDFGGHESEIPARAETSQNQCSQGADMQGSESLDAGGSEAKIARNSGSQGLETQGSESLDAGGREVGIAARAERFALDEEQGLAVEHRGALLVVAGPGTGKTRTLTARIARLIQRDGLPPESALAITFTNKAAREMSERLHDSLGAKADAITVCTFHALGLRILREHSELAGLPENFTICEPQEIWEAMGSPESENPGVLERISRWKSDLLSPEDAPPCDRSAWLAYQEALGRYRGIDIDDIVSLPVRLLEREESVRRSWQLRFRAVAVDEYQDLNRAQYRLLRLLLSPTTDLCAIGDPDQAIYGFRGAQVGFFLEFGRDFPDAREIRLFRNYRCPAEIARAAARVISHNRVRLEGSIEPTLPAGEGIAVHRAPSEKAEAEFIVHTIERLLGGTTHFSLDSERATGHEGRSHSFRSFAVLYRLSSQARVLEEAIARSGMPYQIACRRTVWQEPTLLLWKSLLRLLADPERDLDWLHVLRRTPGIGEIAMGKIRSAGSSIRSALQSRSVGLSRKADASAGAVLQYVRDWSERLSAEPRCLPLSALLESMPFETWNPEERSREILAQAARRTRNLQTLLAELALRDDSDSIDPRTDRIRLMTLHAAKGLEFPVVFVAGCEEGLLPHFRDGEAIEDSERQSRTEEERRLFYVGMTRAREALYLIHSAKRGGMGARRENRAPSPYLSEIPEECRREVRTARPRKPPESEQICFF